MREAGLEGLIGDAVPGDVYLALPRAEWQAILLATFVIPRLKGPAIASSIRTKEVFGDLVQKGLLPRGIPAYIDPAMVEDLARAWPGFRTPYQLVTAYLDGLHRQGMLDPIQKSWMLTRRARQDWRDHQALRDSRAKNGASYRRLIDTILSHIPEDEQGLFDAFRWWRTPLADHGGSPAELFACDQPSPYALERQFDAIEALVLRQGKAVDATLGLPVDGANRRAIAREEEKQAEKARKDLQALADARTGRRTAIQRQAQEKLAGEASQWLASTLPDLDGRTPVAAAEHDASGLDQATRALRHAAVARDARLTQARWQKQISDVASGSRKPDHALLFLRLPNPDFHNQRPIDICRDEASFRRLCGAIADVVR